ncbi:tetratricopeptide repeat protein [uncultured Parabacteroides sp.]|mgnify:CR=1 FL=1|uniref:tetratricopeptide repeat protein n=1 Tax=uncultured Parabacteroides sp. TaxID=512312 RepID=UPI002804AEE4|nr:tetratricopeptide repeat protein [uncultured Parabacteroides sp.]
MKNTFCILSLLFVVYIVACTDSRVPALPLSLSHVESIMYDYPDSALSLLESMVVPSDKYQRAVYSLLLVQARDKNYVKHTSDSLINVAYDYFMKREDPHRRALVLNYEGRVNEDLREVEKATKFYLRAADEVKDTEDYRLGYLINSNLGMIYAYRGLNQEGLLAFQKAHELAKQSKKSNHIIYSLIGLARIHASTGQWEESISGYKQAIEISKKTNSKKSLGTALSELGAVYQAMGKYKMALTFLKRAEKEKLDNKRTILQTYLGLGDTYRFLEQYDSASFYLIRSLVTDNMYTKMSAYLYLYLIQKDMHNYEKAIEYNDRYLQCRDSVDQINRSHVVAEIQAKYDHEKLKNEKITLELEKSQLLKSSLFALSLLLLAIVVLVYIYQRRLLKRERTIQEDKVLLLEYTRQLSENDMIISRNQERIEELSGEISNHIGLEESIKEQSSEIESLHNQNYHLQEANKSLQENIDKFTYSLQQKDLELEDYKKLSKENICLRDREKFLCDQLMKQTTLLKELRLSPKCIKTQGEWEGIIEAVDILHDNYTVRLHEQFSSLTESDLQICCLIKLHLNNSTIATLTGISPASVTKRKQRMKERMGLDLDEKESLDMWLRRY